MFGKRFFTRQTISETKAIQNHVVFLTASIVLGIESNILALELNAVL